MNDQENISTSPKVDTLILKSPKNALSHQNTPNL